MPARLSIQSARNRILAGLGSELAFAILPIIIVWFALVWIGHGSDIMRAAEWSFGASVLFGQSLVRFASGLAPRGHAAAGPVALAIAGIIVGGLAPSLIVLFMMLQMQHADATPPTWLVVSQATLFVLSAAVFLILGVVGATLSGHEESASP